MDSSWKLVWSDEFDRGRLPDGRKWSYEEGFIRNHEHQFYTRERRENARIENGNLILEARREEFQGARITSASLTTQGKFSFQYGRAEMRAQIPAGRGTWPAFWLLGEDIDAVGWPRCSEIDIMEHVGFDPGAIHGTLHQIGPDQRHVQIGKQTSVPDFATAFHVYAVEWTPRSIDIFVDDNRYFSYPYAGPATWTFDTPCHIKLNLAIGGDWGGQKGVDETALPARYSIEYVRVYQKPEWPRREK